MAGKSFRPGRTLVVFFVVVAISYGLVALGGSWKPELGLDLKGGTRITLTANGSPTSSNLKEAAGIIDQRVNGSGVAEAEVTTQGSKYIVVEIPDVEQPGRDRQAPGPAALPDGGLHEPEPRTVRHVGRTDAPVRRRVPRALGQRDRQFQEPPRHPRQAVRQAVEAAVPERFAVRDSFADRLGQRVAERVGR